MEINGHSIRVAKFHNIENARNWAEHGVKAMWIVLGDDNDILGGFWVCRPVDAARLERAGYELA